jgi:hypothetical protein
MSPARNGLYIVSINHIKMAMHSPRIDLHNFQKRSSDFLAKIFPDDTVFHIRAEDAIKVERRVKCAKDHIEVVTPPREGKKLLMLDIDYTFFDHRSPADNALQLRRPYLHEMLTAVREWGFENSKVFSEGHCGTVRVTL